MDDATLETLRWQLLRCLFDATMDLSPDARRGVLLRATSDATLRAEVQALLEADARNRGGRDATLQVSRLARRGASAH